MTTVHVVVYNEHDTHHVGMDIFSSFHSAVKQFDQQLKDTLAEHPDDPEWIEQLLREPERGELYFIDKSGYEVFYCCEVLQD